MIQYIETNQTIIPTWYIYRIECIDKSITEFYIGSTGLSIPTRLNTYKTEYNRGFKKKLYEFMRENGGLDNFELIVIDTIRTFNKDSVTDLEREWQMRLNPELNTYIAGGSDINRQRTLRRRTKKDE